MIALFVLPHMIHASLTNSKIQGKYRHSFWSEIYETVLAWYIAPPTMVALINPHKGKFNVTAKGGLVEEEYVDWVISRPYIFLVLLNLVGVDVGIWRYIYGPENEILTVWVSMVWVFYNLIILGGAVAVSVGKQTGSPFAPCRNQHASGYRPRRWTSLLLYRSRLFGWRSGDQNQRSGEGAGGAERPGCCLSGTAGVCLPGKGRAGERQ